MVNPAVLHEVHSSLLPKREQHQQVDHCSLKRPSPPPRSVSPPPLLVSTSGRSAPSSKQRGLPSEYFQANGAPDVPHEEGEEVVTKKRRSGGGSGGPKGWDLSLEDKEMFDLLPRTAGITWDSSLKRWMAHMPPGFQGVRSRCFAVSKFGMVGSWEEAVKCRLEAMACVDEMGMADIPDFSSDDPDKVKAAMKTLPNRPKGLSFDRSSQRWLLKYFDPTTQTQKYKSFCLRTHGSFTQCFVKAMVFHRRIEVEHKKLELSSQLHSAVSEGAGRGPLERTTGVSGRTQRPRTATMRSPTVPERQCDDNNDEQQQTETAEIGKGTFLKDELCTPFNPNVVKTEEDSDCAEREEELGESYFADLDDFLN
eukprot:GHVS01022160.1.p1 GENE.GHVS01022160.1~~GHVS01022160.1.p1  ORF type:complete len:366 (+),score=69.06 GHVS01022160.1:124-1221(+)